MSGPVESLLRLAGELVAERDGKLKRIALAVDNDTVRGHGQECLRQAVGYVGEPIAVVVVALARDGRYAIRSAIDRATIAEFDVYSRVEHISERMRDRCAG